MNGSELVAAKIFLLCRNLPFFNANLSTLLSTTLDSLALIIFTSIYWNQNWALYISINAAQSNPFAFVQRPERSQYSSLSFIEMSAPQS